MKKRTVQQEILLVIPDSSSQKKLLEKTLLKPDKHYTWVEQLENACMHGLLYKILPGMIQRNRIGKELLVWQAKRKTGCLEMELGEIDYCEIDYPFSISPNYFMPEKIFN